jgi:hypothetical protein
VRGWVPALRPHNRRGKDASIAALASARGKAEKCPWQEQCLNRPKRKKNALIWQSRTREKEKGDREGEREGDRRAKEGETEK